MHETRLKEQKKKMLKAATKEDPVDLKAKKGDPVALKAKKGKAIIKSSSSFDNNQDDTEFSLLVIVFKTFFKSKEGQKFLLSKRRQFNKVSRQKKIENFGSDVGLECHNCGKPGHFHNECPLKKKNAKGKKSFKATTWDMSSGDEEMEFTSLRMKNKLISF